MPLLSQKNFSTLSDFGTWKCYYFWTVLLVFAENRNLRNAFLDRKWLDFVVASCL